MVRTVTGNSYSRVEQSEPSMSLTFHLAEQIPEFNNPNQITSWTLDPAGHSNYTS